MQNYICSQNFLLNQGPQLRIRGEEEKLQRFSIGNSLILPSQNEKYSNTTIQGKWMVQIYDYDHCSKKSYSQVIFDKDTENTQWEKDGLFNKWCRENWTATCKKMKLGPCFIPVKKLTWKYIKNCNLRLAAIKFLEENLGERVLDTGLDKDFLEKTSKAQTMKASETTSN